MDGELSVAMATGAEAWPQQFWFWAAAVTIWLRGVAGAYGAPRRLIRAAAREPAAAALALDLTRYRLGPGRALPIGLAPFRWPFLGAAIAYAIAQMVLGASGALILCTMIAPIVAADLLLETRIIERTTAARDTAPDHLARAAFVEGLSEALRFRTAATLIAIVATLVVLAVQ